MGRAGGADAGAGGGGFGEVGEWLIGEWGMVQSVSIELHNSSRSEHPQVRLVCAKPARGRARLRGDCKASRASQ